MEIRWFKKAYHVDHEDVPSLYKMYIKYYHQSKAAGWEPMLFEEWVRVNKFILKRKKLIEDE